MMNSKTDIVNSKSKVKFKLTSQMYKVVPIEASICIRTRGEKSSVLEDRMVILQNNFTSQEPLDTAREYHREQANSYLSRINHLGPLETLKRVGEAPETLQRNKLAGVSKIEMRWTCEI
jgi:hypothetical protein